MAARERADKLMVAQGLAESREKAQAYIMSGQVWVGDVEIKKAGQLIAEDTVLELRGEVHPYVSRGGLKLAKALSVFHVDPTGLVCLDIGASTGGFTDCLLQNGAARVYAVDVGYGQLAWTLRQDERVVNLERQNFRYLDNETMLKAIDLAVSDVSFISLKHIFSRLPLFLKPNGQVIALVKPQFEAGKEKVGKRGVVRDPAVHLEVLQAVQGYGGTAGLQLLALDWSPIKGPQGNIEFLSLWRLCRADSASSSVDLDKVVADAHEALTGTV